MPPSDSQKMERIEFAVPKNLLDEAIAIADEDGFSPAAFYRHIWLEGLFAYAERSGHVIDRKLKRLASEMNNSKKD